MPEIKLNQIELNIIEALGDDTLKLEELAPRAGYEVGGYLRKTLSSLVKRGILGNKKPGYFVQPEYQTSSPHSLRRRAKSWPARTPLPILSVV